MTQPYDYWHVQTASGLTLPFQGREWTSPAVSAAQYAWGMLTARPFFVGDNGLKVSRIGLRLSAATYTGLCRVGIYACPPPSTHNMFPSTLVADLGDLNLNGTQNPYITAGTPVELSPGFHYVATRFYNPGASSPAVGSRHGEASVGGPGYPLGFNQVTGVGYIGFSAYNPSGPLPATFPAICPRNYGVAMNSTNPPTAIYMESDVLTSGSVQISWVYSGVATPGVATRTTDTAAQVTVTYGPNTLVSTVMTAFEGSSHIRDGRVFNVGATTTMPNAGSSGITTLQAGGPLQTLATQVGNYFPATAIEVVI